jgi:hypothetical protein
VALQLDGPAVGTDRSHAKGAGAAFCWASTVVSAPGRRGRRRPSRCRPPRAANSAGRPRPPAPR